MAAHDDVHAGGAVVGEPGLRRLDPGEVGERLVDVLDLAGPEDDLDAPLAALHDAQDSAGRGELVGIDEGGVLGLDPQAGHAYIVAGDVCFSAHGIENFFCYLERFAHGVSILISFGRSIRSGTGLAFASRESIRAVLFRLVFLWAFGLARHGER